MPVPSLPGSLLTSVVALGVAVVAYGVASLLQAMAARRTDGGGSGQFLLSPLVFGGLSLDLVGFLGGAVALRELPLFFVQGASAASILVTALLASLVLKERPDRREALAMPMVLTGLAALAVAAEPGSAEALPSALVVALIAAVPAFAAGGVLCWNRAGRLPSLGLALLAGLSYGAASLAVRGLSAPGHGGVWAIPVLVTTVAHALLGVALVTAAMHRLTVNTVTSMLFTTETVVPATVGLLLLGDRTGPGLEWLAALGCVLIVLATALISHQTAPTLPGRRRGGPTPGHVAGHGLVPAPRPAFDLRPAARPVGAHRSEGQHRSVGARRSLSSSQRR
jgi:drug/metabolite transporter (DMT)-like permease